MLERILDDVPPPAPTTEVRDDAYEAALATERTRVLRRRLLWYCVIAAVALGVSLLWNVVSLIFWDDTEVARVGSRLDSVSDVILIAIFVCAGAYIRVRKPDHEGLVRVLRRIWFAAGGIVLVTQPLVVYLQMTSEMGPKFIAGNSDAMLIAGAGLTAIFVLHFAGSLIIPLTWREASEPVVLLWVMFGVVAMVLYPGHWMLRILMVLAFPAVGAPGVFWSLRSYKLLGERFHSRVLGERYGELKNELQYARRIHESLFPPEDAPVVIHRGADSVEIRYWYEPMREIGGDFLYVHDGGDDGVTVVLLDVSGHGVPAALAVNRLHGEIQRFFAEQPGASPRELIADLNAYAQAALAPQGMYATAIAVRVIGAARSRRLQWSSAGHPPAAVRPILGGMVNLESTCTMLGVLPRDAFTAEEHERPAAPGDRVILFTDGAMDVRNEHGDQLTLPEVQRSMLPVRSSQDDPLEGVKRRIQAHRGRAPFADDCLVVQLTVR